MAVSVRRFVGVAAATLVAAAIAALPPAGVQAQTSKAKAAADGPEAPSRSSEAGGGEMPVRFKPAQDSFDFVRREVMIAMRDGVKLHTVILIPRGASRAPILLTRTPYNANELTNHAQSSHLESVLNGYDNPADVIVGGGYIRVVQDVRGKYGSQGDYVMNRPLRGGPLNRSKVDHATDTYDTIDWLVKNIAETNGKVGILGISYDGFLPLMALVHPHPALKVAVPMNPMVDGWMGDDWFHRGAFRQQNIPYIYEQDGTRANTEKWWSGVHDDYDLYMRATSAGELAKAHGLDQTGFWRKITAHPAYDAFWQDQAVDKLLANEPLSVPVMLVHSLWDAEDIYGAIAVYKALKAKDVNHDKLFLVMGPWDHGQEIEEGSSLGSLRFGSDTALWFRTQVLRPFLDHYLKDGSPPGDVAPVTAFETGTNVWRRLPTWPAGCAAGCTPASTPLYLQPGSRLGFAAKAGPTLTEDYVSDPAKPVPFRARPIQPVGYDNGMTWPEWLVDDQREASGRPDVLSFTSDVLATPLKISGEPVVQLTAATSGTDADWVVKLIDVYPDEVASDPRMGGYQLMVSADVLRGRYRESYTDPKPLKPDIPLAYRFPLPTANHVFLPGHRIMVQIQSSWFPLYDRNPQTFVDNIFFAKPDEYQKATQRVVVSGEGESRIDLPTVMTMDPAFPTARQDHLH